MQLLDAIFVSKMFPVEVLKRHSLL